jgi:ferric-dicitrate binding protein FerR (iron transport regulator)
VWLNNASSLHYPITFTEKYRERDAYFEIAHNARMPFKVKIQDMVVNVLGTGFNIAAYGDEGQVKTTLLTGAVRVSQFEANTLLKPGEQVQVTHAVKVGAPKEVDTEGMIAWKKGLFHFEKADKRSVIKLLAKWYDLDII